MGYLEHWKKASLVGAFFISAFFASTVPAAGCPTPGQLNRYAVQKVVDGDTLRLVDGRSVRLIGINAPELAHHGRPTEAFADAARKRLQALVAASDGAVALQPGKQRQDHYGRLLAHAYDVRGQNLEAQLLGEGLGFLVAVAPNLELVDCQRAAEQAARRAGLGVWRQPPLRTPAQISESGFALVQARIEEVARNRGGLWLETDGPLVLHVAPKFVANFDAAALQRLAGRRVEARGWIIDLSRRGGVKPGQARWMLPLTDGAMLEVLP